MSAIKTMTVGQVALTGAVHTVPEDVSIKDVAKLMADRGANVVLVVGPDQIPLGILTAYDIVARITNAAKDAATVKAGTVMSAPVITAGQDESIGYAIATMLQRNIRQLPTVDKQGRVASLLTLKDIFHLHLAGTLDLTDIASRLVELPAEQTEPSVTTTPVQAKAVPESSGMPKAFKTQMPFRPAVPAPVLSDTPSEAAGKPAGAGPAVPSFKRAAPGAVPRHRDGRRRRTVIEKIQHAYFNNKMLVLVVATIAVILFFVVMVMAKGGVLFDAYQASHYEPKDEERARLLQQK